jgi:hypothetical protein
MFDGKALAWPRMKDAWLWQHWSASLLIWSHPGPSFWLRRVSGRIQSTMMWYRNAAKASKLFGTA